MSRIIAGVFTTQEEGEATRDRLTEAGFGASDISIFFNNAPGQHGDLPAGGDEAADPKARGAGAGAATGAAIGAGVGLAGLIAGPAGLAAAGVAAYVGSLAGTAGAMGDQDSEELRRPAGVMVAVNAGEREREVIQVLRECRADNIERADGQWTDGHWIDFDPVTLPRMVDQSELHGPGDESFGKR